MTAIQAAQILNGLKYAAQERNAMASREITNGQGQTKTLLCLPGRRVRWCLGYVATSRDALFDWLVA